MTQPLPSTPGTGALPSLARRIVFTGKQQVQLQESPLGPPHDEEVIVETKLSLMSTGTENIVFNRLFDAGSHFDNWVKYPFYPGYANVGTVIAVGAKVTGMRPGDRVACRASHSSHNRLSAQSCYPIPPQLSWEQAVWFALAKIAFMGALAAHYQLGDQVLIIGAGPVGQMTIRWAHAAGTMITAVDGVPGRLALAQAGGASAVIDQPIDQARAAILAAGRGALPRVVVDSTGNAAVFAPALGLAADRGTVVILGDTGSPRQQALTPDVILRGLKIVGAHDGHDTPQWNNATITQLFFGLVTQGRFNVDGMVSHRFAPAACAEAYGIANTARGATMGISFTW